MRLVIVVAVADADAAADDVVVADVAVVAAVVHSGMAHEYSWWLPGQSFIHS